eukprot:c7689_g1_i1.p1 GENE.c7689_g1_i1~~c7689_g1_i1.p1  ORF type:complete len:369 (+),score=87.92 c7689_g1_i1:77-1108(+)
MLEDEQEALPPPPYKWKLPQHTPQLPIFENAFARLMGCGVMPVYSRNPLVVDGKGAAGNWWSQLTHVPGCDPLAGLLKPDRATRKRQQVANMCRSFEMLLQSFPPCFLRERSPLTIVEFCASSGYIAIPLAKKFPNCQFVLLDMKETSIAIAHMRVRQAGVQNVRVVQGLVQDWNERFDVGIALHACGEVTDMVQEVCVKWGASYVLGPCCVGKIQNSKLRYPRSRAFSLLLSGREYSAIAAAGDLGHSDEGDTLQPQHTTKTQSNSSDEAQLRRRVCKAFVELDRNLFARETKHNPYITCLMLMEPQSCTPKNDMMVGWPRSLFERAVYTPPVPVPMPSAST